MQIKAQDEPLLFSQLNVNWNVWKGAIHRYSYAIQLPFSHISATWMAEVDPEWVQELKKKSWGSGNAPPPPLTKSLHAGEGVLIALVLQDSPLLIWNVLSKFYYKNWVIFKRNQQYTSNFMFWMTVSHPVVIMVRKL